MSDLFGRSYSELDGGVKNRVLDFIVKLQERPDAPGLDVKSPAGVTDPRIKTARVTDFWRAVLIELPESHGFILVAVKPHDDAYKYAARLRFGVNEVTGALEVVDQAALEEAVTRAGTGRPEQPAAEPVLHGVRRRDLVRFGVAEEIAEHLVGVTDEDEFLAIATALPAVQGNAVADLAAGRSPDEVWADLVQVSVPDIDASDIESALDRPLSRLTFTDGRNVDELRAVLEGDFKAWRVWLHPLQRTLAYHDGWRGPFRVTGGAGTGKTVTAVHRAKHLAQHLHREDPDVRVLVTTFTKNLAHAIEAQLVELAGNDVRARADVLNIDALAQRILARHEPGERRAKLCSDDDPAIVAAWDAARVVTTEPWPVDFLQSEWSQVVLAQGISDRDGYLRASRSGRGRRLSRPQRAELWSVFERFTQLLTAQELMTFTQAASRAAAVTAVGTAEPGAVRYRHAIIDEAQDLHPAHWRLLRAVVPPGDDDLFIVGDAHQRIYGRQVVLSRFGIETRGRSRRLTVNYRTSREILRWSLGVTYDQAVDDLEGEEETLAGARSEFRGPEPLTRGFQTGAQEKTALADTLQEWHKDNISWSQMAVMARQRWLVDDFMTALDNLSVPTAKLDANTEEEALGDQVRVMTMHRAKGLEFRAVAVVGAGDKDLPPPAIRQLEGEERDVAWRRERNLLYVSSSRARERLYVSWVGKPSELMRRVGDPPPRTG